MTATSGASVSEYRDVRSDATSVAASRSRSPARNARSTLR
jgi:hypothetical protein